MSLMKDLADQIVQPNPVVTTGAVVSVTNLFSSLPTIINVVTIIYLVLAIVHKGWQMHKEWKASAHTK